MDLLFLILVVIGQMKMPQILYLGTGKQEEVPPVTVTVQSVLVSQQTQKLDLVLYLIQVMLVLEQQ